MAEPGPLDWLATAREGRVSAGLQRTLRHRDQPFSYSGLIDVSSNDYLGLARDPRLIAALRECALWGAGAGASRLIVGGSQVHADLEAAIAAWKGTEDAVVFSSGYLANVGTIQALVGPGDLIVSDALNHASIIDGCRLSGATVAVYRHGDVTHAADLLARRRSSARSALVVTDGVFSMDGDAADLPGLCATAEAHGAMVMVDDAHGSGLIGPDGRGTPAAQGVADRVHVHLGTLSKAVGAAGGFVAGRADLIDHLRNTARTFVFDTALPPAIAAAALVGVQIARHDAELRTAALARAQRLAAGVGAATPAGCIIPLVIGRAEDAMSLAAGLQEDGFLAVAIRPPSVPRGTSRLRIAVGAAHSEDTIDHLISSVQARVAAS